MGETTEADRGSENDEWTCHELDIFVRRQLVSRNWH